MNRITFEILMIVRITGNIYLHKDFIATFTKSSPVYKLR